MHIFAALGVCQEYHRIAQEADHIDALLTVGKPDIFFCNHRTIEYCLATNEIQPMSADIAQTLVFIPSDHGLIVLTIYRKIKANVHAF